MGESTNDDLNTPEWILDLVRRMGPIGLDPCSNRWSTVGARFSVGLPDADGLDVDWELLTDVGKGSCFVNPPYSRPLPWARKFALWRSCLTDAFTGPEPHGFVLVKCAPSTRWWKVLMSVASARVDFHKRITFEGGAHKSGMMDSTMFYAGPSPYLFAHIFSPHGEVRVYR